MKNWIAFVALFLAAMLCTSASHADVTIGYTDSGWYRAPGDHGATNLNYTAGNGDTYRNFFVFDLSGVTEAITSAKLRLDTVIVSASGTYNMWDVSTDITTLRAGGTNLGGILTDLGTGTSYGTGSILASQDNTVLEFDLTAAAIAELNTSGGLWAIGGSYSSDGSAFSDSHTGNPVRELVVTVVPEPSTVALWMVMGLIGCIGLRARRKK